MYAKIIAITKMLSTDSDTRAVAGDVLDRGLRRCGGSGEARHPNHDARNPETRPVRTARPGPTPPSSRAPGDVHLRGFRWRTPRSSASTPREESEEADPDEPVHDSRLRRASAVDVVMASRRLWSVFLLFGIRSRADSFMSSASGHATKIDDSVPTMMPMICDSANAAQRTTAVDVQREHREEGDERW